MNAGVGLQQPLHRFWKEEEEVCCEGKTTNGGREEMNDG